jgi:ribosomal protein L11 methyltransferase
VIRLSLRVRRADAEVVLAELLELVPTGCEERDLGDDVEYALYGAPGELPALPELRAVIGGALVDVSTEEIPDDWSERWREFHRPLVIGDALVVRPPWEPAQDAALDIVIDPGQAFGTGAHGTTRLCLEIMLELPPGGPLLDLGCGSGVLAIAAAKLGWDPVTAVDFDPLAVDATRANAAVNGVRLDVARHDLRDGPPPAAPVVLANLLRPLLLRLAEGLADVPETLVASGLLVGEEDEVVAAFAPLGLVERERRARGEWAALVLARDAVRTPQEDAGHERTTGQPPPDRTRRARG